MAPRHRSHRLTKRWEFEAVLAQGSRVAGRYFSVRAYRSGLTRARLGIIAGRKALRRAVDRNSCKRIVRAAFHESRDRLAGFDVVVTCHSALSRGARALARHELGRLFEAATRNSVHGPKP